MKTGLHSIIERSLKESIETKTALLSSSIETIARIAEVSVNVLKGGGKMILFGNGGSAADAQHLAAELVGRFSRNRKAIPALSLTVNTSVLTAVANDYDFSRVFVRQLEAYLQPHDMVIGISTSGNSDNVLEAFRYARSHSVPTIGFTGGEGGKMKDLVDYCLVVPSRSTARIQEAHITIGHILCELIEMEV